MCAFSTLFSRSLTHVCTRIETGQREAPDGKCQAPSSVPWDPRQGTPRDCITPLLLPFGTCTSLRTPVLAATCSCFAVQLPFSPLKINPWLPSPKSAELMLHGELKCSVTACSPLLLIHF